MILMTKLLEAQAIYHMELVLENNWFVSMAKIFLLICNCYFDLVIGIFEGLFQRSNFVEKLPMVVLGYAPTIIFIF